MRFFGDHLDVVSAIPITCIVLFLFCIAREPRAAFEGNVGIFDFLSPSTRALVKMGMTGTAAWFSGGRVEVYRGEWWTVFTAIFLHGSLIHIFFNVMWIRSLGPAVAEAYGQARYFILFIASGAVGFIVSNAASGGATVGASGSIFGLLAAMIVAHRRSGTLHGRLASRQLWQWAIALFVLGFLMSRVNNWAHGGGFLAGWLVATLMTRDGLRVERGYTVIAALVLLGFTLFGFANVALGLVRDLTR